MPGSNTNPYGEYLEKVAGIEFQTTEKVRKNFNDFIKNHKSEIFYEENTRTYHLIYETQYFDNTWKHSAFLDEQGNLLLYDLDAADGFYMRRVAKGKNMDIIRAIADISRLAASAPYNIAKWSGKGIGGFAGLVLGGIASPAVTLFEGGEKVKEYIKKSMEAGAELGGGIFGIAGGAGGIALGAVSVILVSPFLVSGVLGNRARKSLRDLLNKEFRIDKEKSGNTLHGTVYELGKQIYEAAEKKMRDQKRRIKSRPTSRSV